MTSQIRKISFDAQETITYLVETFDIDHKEVVGSWVLLDPKVGGWLLNPDHPPITFMQTVLSLQTSLPKMCAGHQDDVLHGDLEALSSITQVLYTKLCQSQLWTIFLHLEMRIVPTLAVMELRGIRVDKEVLKQRGHMLKLKIQEVEKRCHQVSGSVFNVTSHAQLRTVLYQELKLDIKNKVVVPRTAAGQKSTSEVALGRLVGFHPLPELVLHHRLLNKLKTTYIDGIMACVQGSYIKAAWEQTSASTGRIQCRNPNLQSIPKHSVTVTLDNIETVVLAREFFRSRDGYILVAADFQQTELRMLAHLSQDAVLLAGFRQPKSQLIDIFKQLSALWLGKDVSEVTTSERERTKRVVYAVIYGAGRDKLAEVLHLSPLEAKDIISSFMKHFPGIPGYMRCVVDLCKAQGFLTTIFNRRRFFPGITSQDSAIQAQAERQAVNFVIQGSAADISKAAMVQTEAALASRRDLDARLLIHIHDELVWEVSNDHVNTFINIIWGIMEDTRKLCGPFVQVTVPLPVAVYSGANWAHLQPWISK
nr:DNA polymerase nu-like [Procambarus clarkii]